jgi:hypothetical protein
LQEPGTIAPDGNSHGREGSEGLEAMMSFEDSGIIGEQSAIAAIAVFRKLATLCAPDSAAPLPLAMEALLQRLGEAAPRTGEVPQQLVESP